MLERAACILILLGILSQGRPCLSIPEIPRDREQVYGMSRDSVIVDSNGVTMDALILTKRTILFTGSAFIVIDILRLRAGNPYPNHRESVIVRRDSGTAPPRELDLCNYADSIDTVLFYEGDSLYIAFLPGEGGPREIQAVFSLQEGFLFYYLPGADASHLMAAREDEEGAMKKDYALSYLSRQSGIFRAAKQPPKRNPGGFPGFSFANSRFDASGRRLASRKAE